MDGETEDPAAQMAYSQPKIFNDLQGPSQFQELPYEAAICHSDSRNPRSENQRAAAPSQPKEKLGHPLLGGDT